MEYTFHITTFGCQMNEHDSEVICGMLEEIGMRRVEERRDAQIVIINTCSVRDNADKRFFGTLGQLKRRKMADPDFTVCVCGCMMQQQHVIDTLKEKYPWVDVVFGTLNIHRFPELLINLLKEKEKQVEIWPEGGEIVEGLPYHRLFQCKALVNIMYGCNNFCTYCIVPYTRGRERSRHPENILAELRELTADGVREVMFLGQNVNSYRGTWEDGTPCSFAQLLEAAAETPGLERIRFMTSHPKDISDELIELFGRCDKLCKNIHLPVQSGSTEIMQRMNRRYTRESYLEIVRKLRKVAPDITISTDIIVGFPGETEEQFEETLSLVEEVRYDSAFTFLYSKRKGTPAAEMPDQIPEDVKHERFNRLVEAVNRISAEKNALYRGRVEKVLCEGPSKRNSLTMCGRTDGFKLVNFRGSKEMVGQMVDIEITEGKTFSLEGRVRET